MMEPVKKRKKSDYQRIMELLGNFDKKITSQISGISDRVKNLEEVKDLVETNNKSKKSIPATPQAHQSIPIPPQAKKIRFTIEAGNDVWRFDLRLP